MPYTTTLIHGPLANWRGAYSPGRPVKSMGNSITTVERAIKDGHVTQPGRYILAHTGYYGGDIPLPEGSTRDCACLVEVEEITPAASNLRVVGGW